MLSIYNTLEDVPEVLREHYRKQDGRYVPHLSEDHPVVAHNKTLLSEKSAATAKVKELEADMEQAKSTSLPRGHVAVAKADAELLDKFKSLGKPEELTAKLGEHEVLKAEVDRHKRDSHLEQVAKVMGYDNVEAFKRLSNLPDFEIKGEGDKRTVVAKVRDGDKIVEKPAVDFMTTSPDHAPFLGALKTTGGVQVHGTPAKSQSQPQNVFDKIRSDVKVKQEAQQAHIHPMFKRIAGRVAPAQGEQ